MDAVWDESQDLLFAPGERQQDIFSDLSHRDQPYFSTFLFSSALLFQTLLHCGSCVVLVAVFSLSSVLTFFSLLPGIQYVRGHRSMMVTSDGFHTYFEQPTSEATEAAVSDNSMWIMGVYLSSP